MGPVETAEAFIRQRITALRATNSGKAWDPLIHLSLNWLSASIHPEDRPGIRALLRAGAVRGSDSATEFRVFWPDGSIHWVEIRARVVHDRKGRRSRLVGVCSDVTARKTAEARQIGRAHV